MQIALPPVKPTAYSSVQSWCQFLGTNLVDEERSWRLLKMAPNAHIQILNRPSSIHHSTFNPKIISQQKQRHVPSFPRHPIHHCSRTTPLFINFVPSRSQQCLRRIRCGDIDDESSSCQFLVVRNASMNCFVGCTFSAVCE